MLYYSDNKTWRERVAVGLHLQVKTTLLITKELLEKVLCRIKPIQFQESRRRSYISLSVRRRRMMRSLIPARDAQVCLGKQHIFKTIQS